MMLRLLLLTLLLTVKAATSDSDGSGDGDYPDQEKDEEDSTIRPQIAAKVKNDLENPEEGNMTIIIVAAVIVGALTVLAIIAVVLFKRHLQRREQGVYTVPVDQGQKGV